MGLRVVVYDRPGYGASTGKSGRSTVESAADVAAVADHLGFERFALVGLSGGAGHTLAAASQLGDRVTRCALIVPMGPFDAPGLDFFQGMTGAERTHWGRIAAEGVAYVSSSEYPDLLQWIRSLPDDDRLPPADRQMLVDTLTEALRPGASGLAEDRMVAVRSWGFQVSDIRCLTHVLVGEDDRALRPHGEWLADHIPGADLVVAPGDHLGPRDTEEEQLLAWVAEST